MQGRHYLEAAQQALKKEKALLSSFGVEIQPQENANITIPPFEQ